jgi:hypothetical protein
VTRGTVPKSKAEKYQQFFINKIVPKLEKNALNVANPQILHETKFQKFKYAYPDEITAEMALPKDKKGKTLKGAAERARKTGIPPVWKSILENVNMGNINLFYSHAELNA